MPIGPFMAAALPVIGNIVSNTIGAGVQSIFNRRASNLTNFYNTPAAQMQRYIEAGLNPNLIYSQGTSGNMSPLPVADWQGAVSNLGSQYVQSELAQTQTDVGQQKIQESRAKTQLIEAQREVTKANPYLDATYLKGVVDNMVSTARIKVQEADFLTSGTASTGATTQGQAKMMLEINNLAQRTGLLEADQKVKDEIIKSQKFTNELKALQVKWLKDGDITPQHIYQGIMMLLSKMM